MAVTVLTNASVLVNTVDLSDHVTKVGIDTKAGPVDSTAMSSTGWKSFLGGLKEFSVMLDFQQDLAAAKVYATLWPLLGTVTTFEIRAVNSARSVTNPGYTGSVLIADVPILGSTQVGTLAMVSVTWPGTGAFTPQTS